MCEDAGSRTAVLVEKPAQCHLVLGKTAINIVAIETNLSFFSAYRPFIYLLSYFILLSFSHLRLISPFPCVCSFLTLYTVISFCLPSFLSFFPLLISKFFIFNKDFIMLLILPRKVLVPVSLIYICKKELLRV